jgi:hypothetical protein
MELLQQILVYLILALAVGYIVKKFFLPKSLFASKEKGTKVCGQEDCGCH